MPSWLASCIVLRYFVTSNAMLTHLHAILLPHYAAFLSPIISNPHCMIFQDNKGFSRYQSQLYPSKLPPLEH